MVHRGVLLGILQVDKRSLDHSSYMNTVKACKNSKVILPKPFTQRVHIYNHGELGLLIPSIVWYLAA